MMITTNACPECGDVATETAVDGVEYCPPCATDRCNICGEKHPDEEHFIVMRERALDARDRWLDEDGDRRMNMARDS